uniref:Secretion regulating guanine nucleotide exchange factor n=1 Tax=Leptobrachium leishanense TaxID=445787 RepID=A0A8C5MSF3_9ANUR
MPPRSMYNPCAAGKKSQVTCLDFLPAAYELYMIQGSTFPCAHPLHEILLCVQEIVADLAAVLSVCTALCVSAYMPHVQSCDIFPICFSIDTGALYVCGQNRDGQLGLSHTDDVSHFSLCSSLQSERVSTVSCGWDFTIILTDSGRVLSCGSNAFGQLGIPHVKSSSVPEPVQSLQEKVLDISAGLRHSLALTDSGGVFQWGVGLASHAKRFSCGNPVPPFLTAKEPSRIPGLENVKGRKVIAGSYHSVTVTEDGDLYVWGSNKHGQLLQKETFVLWPQRIEPHFFSGERIRSAWSGWTHLVAQTDSGKVYTWGRADYGQLGRDGEKEQPQDSGAEHFPKPLLCIPRLTGADQITCGSQHNLAVCGTAVYSWGWNEHGMCGDGTETNVEIPTQISIPAPHPATVKLIACGAGHSMILCVNPGCYSVLLPGIYRLRIC